MKNLKLTTLAVLTTVLFLNLNACKSDTTNKNSAATTPSTTTPTATAENKITVGTFTDFPPEIDGCSCYFSQSEADFKTKKYVYADNYENTAFININGAMVKLTRPDAKSEKSLSEKHVVKTYSNNDYEVTVDINQIKQIEEVWEYKGTLTIKPKNGQTVTVNIEGECGC